MALATGLNQWGQDLNEALINVLGEQYKVLKAQGRTHREAKQEVLYSLDSARDILGDILLEG